MVVASTSLTSTETFQAVEAFIVLGLCILSPGYLLSYTLRCTRQFSWKERSLWTISAGVPLAVGLSVWGQRLLTRTLVDLCFGLLVVVALLIFSRNRMPSSRPRLRPGKLSYREIALLGCLSAMVLYCWLETVDLQFGYRLYLSTLITDWSPRMAMIGGAMRSAVPPLNGLSTLSNEGIGFAPHLRYYYFWFTSLAEAGASLQLRPQALLTASCAWAGLGFLSACLLTLKYILNARQRWVHAGLVFCGLLCILGLDILPTAAFWLLRSYHPMLEMEWWRADRTPSFLGMLLASPHHLAGFCSLLSGTLLLFLLSQPKRHSPNESARLTVTQVVVTTLASGLFFAVASGLALFPTLCFAFGLSFWAVDLLRRRQWSTLIPLAAAGLVALLLAHGYLTELSTGSSAAHGLLGLAWRSDSFAAVEIARFLHPGPHSPLSSFLLRQPAVALLDFMELGFYLFVLCAAVRNDLLRAGRLSPELCLWWALLLGAALPAFFLSSVATNGPNDLGFDSGFLFRLCLQLWAVEWLQFHWERRRSPRTPWQNVGVACALSLAALGLAAQLYQSLSTRLYFPWVGSGRAGKQMDVLTQDHLSQRLYNIYSALAQFDRQVPPSHPDTEAIQFNPVGVLLPPQVYFNTHQIASWDTGCGTSFGGDYSRCGPIFQSLLFLYGNTESGVSRSRAQNTAQDGAANRVATLSDLSAVCQHLRLRAVVADATDSIWSHPESWVWTGPALVANATVRVIACPAGSWRP